MIWLLWDGAAGWRHDQVVPGNCVQFQHIPVRGSDHGQVRNAVIISCIMPAPHITLSLSLSSWHMTCGFPFPRILQFVVIYSFPDNECCLPYLRSTESESRLGICCATRGPTLKCPNVCSRQRETFIDLKSVPVSWCNPNTCIMDRLIDTKFFFLLTYRPNAGCAECSSCVCQGIAPAFI